jgi:hypothetical protein
MSRLEVTENHTALLKRLQGQTGDQVRAGRALLRLIRVLLVTWVTFESVARGHERAMSGR